MVLKFSGRLMQFKEIHPLNACFPINETLSGNPTNDNEEQPLKASALILERPFGRFI